MEGSVMPWVEIVVVLFVWGVARVLSRPKGRVPSVQSPASLADMHPSRIQHDGRCQNCGVQAAVPLSRTRLERSPWRIVWWCAVCGRQSRAVCPDELVPVFAQWDTAGGMSLSMREVAALVQVDLDALNAAVEDELL